MTSDAGTSSETLLRQILANPADDQSRTVYADLLQAAGDPRGELIAVDLELARAPTPALASRKRALLAEHAKRWWPAIPVERIEVKRGFAVRVAGTWPELAAAASMFETEPITSVEVVHPGRDFAGPTWTTKIRELALHDTFDCATIAALPMCQQLEVLDLGDTNLVALEGLATAFPRLRRLGLADNWLLADRLDRVAAWQSIGQLEHVDLRRCGLGAEAIGKLVAKLSSVRTLRLAGNPLGPEGAHELARQLAQLPALAHLDLLDTGFDQAGIDTIRATLPSVTIDTAWPDEVTLDLVGSQLRLIRDAGPLWKVFVDDEQRHANVATTIRYRDDWTDTITSSKGGMSVGLDELAKVIATGAVRALGEVIQIPRHDTHEALSWERIFIRVTPEQVLFAYAEYSELAGDDDDDEDDEDTEGK